MENFKGKPPLADYPWSSEIDRLANWCANKNSEVKAFSFDLAMSLAYIDATAGIEKQIEYCSCAPAPYNSHVGFINLCSPCYELKGLWLYQKAAKPQSGAIGKLSSEIILRMMNMFFPSFEEVLSIGGTETSDAMIKLDNGKIILAEVKSAPLLTYPLLLELNFNGDSHAPVEITSSQLREAESALYLHGKNFIPLGKVKSDLWPFKPAVDFVISETNTNKIDKMTEVWREARDAYKNRDRDNPMFYLANASGSPPQVAKIRDGWPKKETISDSKTSAGMDRTDDIKKGIYQVLKIGADHYSDNNLKTAIISNLPAYRHGSDYVSPFMEVLWGRESDLESISGELALKRQNLKWVFDYIITLDDPVLRELEK